MKSEVFEKKADPKPRFYPYLGIAKDGLVVLFSSVGAGMVIVTGSSTYHIGSYMKAWDDRQFEPMLGKVVLSNED